MSRIDSSGAPATARYLLPAASILVATMLMMLPLPLAWGVFPDFALLLLILWARIQPRLLPPWAAFLLGLAADAILGLPFGILATVFPVVVMATRIGEARFEGHDLLLDWASAGLLVVGGHLLAFELLALAGSKPALAPMLAQAGITILAYPPAAAIAARLQHWLAGVEG